MRKWKSLLNGGNTIVKAKIKKGDQLKLIFGLM